LIESQKIAEAKRYEQEQQAEALRVVADAKKYEALAEADAIKAKGEAEAQAIKAKGLAEAEATDKKADAMSKMKEAAILEMYFKVLPDVAKNVSAPLENIDKITMYGDGNTTKLVKDITNATSQISSGLGIDIKSVLAGVFGTKAMEMVKSNPNLVDEIVKDIPTDNGEES
jgi:flotillin